MTATMFFTAIPVEKSYCFLSWCQVRDSNPHAKDLAGDFKSPVSAIPPTWPIETITMKFQAKEQDLANAK